MIEQPELEFTTQSDPVMELRLDALLSVLRDQAGWLTRRELELLGFGDRELRELVEFDKEVRIFSYPGSPGYKLFDLVTDAEFDRCIALKQQGEKMLGRYTRYLRRWHTRFKSRGDAADES
jgi:hypothetical protein